MPRTHPLFPDPVCRHPDEYGFVCAVLAAPLDDLPKLVYADWLDEHADPRGMFLRTWLAARQGGKKLPKPDKGVSACWLSVMGFTLDAWLAKHGNPPWADAVRGTAAPGLMVRTVRLKDGQTLPTGTSKMGGLPDLDPEGEWPEGDGRPAAFIAQWNLEELAVSPCAAKLPKAGLLSFFIDLIPFNEGSEDGSSEVIFSPDAATAEEREHEGWDYESDEENMLPACRVEFREFLSLPDATLPALGLTYKDDYSLLYDNYPKPKGSHDILGHGWPNQGTPTPPGCTRGKWGLLTQINFDDSLGLKPDNDGAWYFMTSNTALKKGEFDSTLMVFQVG